MTVVGIQPLSSETLHRGTIFDLLSERVRLPSGLEQELLIVDHPGAVCIAPVLSTGELLLVRQYRHAVGEWLIELPAGRLEADEDPARAAARELEEETGHRAAELVPRAEFFPAPGFCSERMFLFEARGLEEIPGGGRPCDADEELELVRLRPEACLASGVRDAKTLVAVLCLLHGPAA